MKHLVEFVDESLRLDESKMVRYSYLIKCIEKINDWGRADNIKKLMAEYMSAGDAEDLSKEHWDACAAVIDNISDIILSDLEGGRGTYDVSLLGEYVVSRLEADHFIDDLNEDDKDGDWDVDECINLFNTVSMKVCKEAWLI